MSDDTTLPHANLPIPPTGLIGRDREIDEIIALIGRPEVRLVTLTGAGGIGKTRLAIEVAARLRPGYPDGVAFIPLAAVRDPALVLAAIAQALNARPRGSIDPRGTVAAALHGKRMLIVLDNFEQVLVGAGDLAWLLETAEGVELLVTSRARLRLRGEHDYVVLPLPTPDAATAVESNPAVQLFLARAHEVAPTLRLSDANAGAIAEICRRLDGIPLAIELAAARARVLPPAALLARLDRRLPILTGGPRDLPDRLRTMRSAIAWSYDLLAPAEQRLFRALCVFTGGFTLAMAESVMGDGSWVMGADDGPGSPGAAPSTGADTALGPQNSALSTRSPSPITHDPSPTVIDGLWALVDASLVQSDLIAEEPRFSVLETPREFGLEELELHGELDAIADRHAAFFGSYAETALRGLRGDGRSVWLDRLDLDSPNLRAALSGLIERGDTELAVRLAGALWQFWWWRAHLDEGRRWLEQVAALPGAAGCGPAYARVLTGLGSVAETLGDFPAAERYHEEATRAWQALDDPLGLATSLLFRWLVAFNADDADRMVALSTESLRLFRQVDDPWGVAMSLMEQGVMAMRLSQHAQGEAVLTEAIATFRSINDRWGIAICQGVLGNIRTDQRRFAEAEQTLEEGLTVLLLLNDLWGVATVLPAMARAAAEQGRFERAVQLSGAIKEMHRTLGMPLKVPFRDRLERNLEQAVRVLGRERFETLLAEGAALGPEEAVRAAFEPTHVNPSATKEKSAFEALAFPLSAREREVVMLVTTMSAREIGETLFIAESTVRTHIDNILNKLGLRNQKELIAYIHKHGLGE